MRKVQLIFLLLVGLLAFNSCSDDDTQPNLKFGDLPLSSQKFLTEYLNIGENDTELILGKKNIVSHYNAGKSEVMFTFYNPT